MIIFDSKVHIGFKNASILFDTIDIETSNMENIKMVVFKS